MERSNSNSASIRRYLLGDLTEPERDQVEQRLITEDDLYQQLLIGEDDLIDEYVSDALSEPERAKFSQRFLHIPELRQDIRFAAALRKHALEAAPQVVLNERGTTKRASPLDLLKKFFMQPALGVSLAMALVAALLLVAWLSTQNYRLREQVEQLQARESPPTAAQQELQAQLAAERLRNEQLLADVLHQQELRGKEPQPPQVVQQQPQPTPTRKPAPQPATALIVALALTPGRVRESGELKKIALPPGIRSVRVSLDLPSAGFRNYQVIVKTVEGREVLTRQGLRAGSGKLVIFNLPAEALSPDDYQILLSGVNSSGETEEISSYYFRVLR